jgi:hypothetical protein
MKHSPGSLWVYFPYWIGPEGAGRYREDCLPIDTVAFPGALSGLNTFF